MKLTADYHTHTPYSHGKNTVIENAERAKELGLSAVAITDHGFSHVMFGVKHKNVPRMIEECREAEKSTGIRVLAGMECNIRGVSGLTCFRKEDLPVFDIFLAGIHVMASYETWADYRLGWQSWWLTLLHGKPSQRLVKDTTAAYVNAVKSNPVDIVTHLNFQCFADAVEVAKCCRDYGTYLEISSKKQHLSDEELDKVVQTGVRFVINSDAHSIDRIGETLLAEEQIERVGVPHDRIDNIDGRLPSFRFEEFKKHL